MEEGKIAMGQESAVTQQGNDVVEEGRVETDEQRAVRRESIGDRIAFMGIICCLAVLATVVILIVILVRIGLPIYWDWVREPRKPSFSIEDFYVPALNRTSNETQNTTIFYDLKLKNRNLLDSIRYGTINLTIYYGQNLSFPIGNVSIPGFDQGIHRKAHRKGAVETVEVPWDTARMEVSNGTATFHVNLDTTVKNSWLFWYDMRKIYRVGNSLRVNDKGSLPKKGVELTKESRSSAPVRGRHRELVGGLVGFALLFVWF